MTGTVNKIDAPVITLSAHHEAVFAAIESGRKAEEKMYTAVLKLVVAEHGKVLPVYEVYMNTVGALSQLASNKGLKDAQYHLRVYRKVLIDEYKALPVSMHAGTRADYLNKLDDGAKKEYETALKEAIDAKQPEYVATAKAVRAAKVVRKQVVKATPGAPAGETQSHPVGPQETFEQMIGALGKPGVFIALDAIIAVLRVVPETAEKAKALNSLRNNLAKELKLADATPAKKAA